MNSFARGCIGPCYHHKVVSNEGSDGVPPYFHWKMKIYLGSKKINSSATKVGDYSNNDVEILREDLIDEYLISISKFINNVKIKNTELNYPGMVYGWFKDKTFGDEKMWVKITKGDRNEGVGTLSNIPIKFKHMDYGNIVKFKTNKKGITYGH